MSDIGTFNPAMLVHGQQAVTLHRPIPPAGHGDADVEAHRHVRQGQGGRRRHRVRRRRWTASRCTRRARRRSSAARAAGAATAARRARRTSRRTASPTTRSRTRRRPTRRSSTGSTATATRCTPTRRSPPPAASTEADPARPVQLRLHRPGLLHLLCGGDPAKFHHIEARFASPVMPGEALTDQGVGDRRRRGRLHDLRRRPRRHRPGPPHVRLTASECLVTGVGPVRTASDARNTPMRQAAADQRLQVGDGVGERHVHALAGAAVLDLDGRRRPRPRPTTTIVGTPISSASLNLTPGDTESRSSSSTRSPAASSSAASASAAGHCSAAGLAGDHDVDVGRGDLARPAQAELVVGRLGDRRHGSRHADAVGAHRHRDRRPVGTLHGEAEGLGVLAAELEDVADLDAAGDLQLLAVGGEVAGDAPRRRRCTPSGVKSRPATRPTTWRPVLVGAGDPAGAGRRPAGRRGSGCRSRSPRRARPGRCSPWPAPGSGRSPPR